MPKVEDIEGLKDIKIGELNDISFDMEDPLLTNEIDGESLLSNLLSAFVKRESAFDRKRPHKGIVLLATKVQTTGVVGVHGIGKKALEFLGVNNIRNFAVVRVPEIHSGIPIPNMQALLEVQANSYERSNKNKSGPPAKFAEISEQDKLLLSMHDPYFSAPIGSDGMVPLKPGDIVLLDGDGIIISKVEDSEVGFFGRLKKGLLNALDWAGGVPLRRSVLDETELTFNEDESGRIMGDDLPGVTGVVAEEMAFWTDKVETDPEAYARLQLYWDTIGVMDWDPVGTPWSAAYISYVLQAAGSGLPGAAAHYLYVEQAKRGEAGYDAVVVKNTSSLVKANIGDVLVKDRGDGREDYFKTHGDIVYAIANDQAYLSGGNLGGTVKTEILELDNDGYYRSFGPYEMLVKLGARFV